jgi:hypothetical protein
MFVVSLVCLLASVVVEEKEEKMIKSWSSQQMGRN